MKHTIEGPKRDLETNTPFSTRYFKVLAHSALLVLVRMIPYTNLNLHILHNSTQVSPRTIWLSPRGLYSNSAILITSPRRARHDSNMVSPPLHIHALRINPLHIDPMLRLRLPLRQPQLLEIHIARIKYRTRIPRHRTLLRQKIIQHL